MKKPEDIVVTGIGAITPIGNDKDTFWKNLTAGVSGADTIRAFDPTGFGSTIACEVKDFRAEELMDKRRAKRMARYSQLAVCAALAARDDAGLDLEREDLTRVGCFIGTGTGDYENIESQHKVLLERGPLKGHPLAVPKIVPNMVGP